MPYSSDMHSKVDSSALRARILDRIAGAPNGVWIARDFADFGPRAVVDKTLQRLVASSDLIRIDRGLYGRPRMNALTGRVGVPDYRAVIQAVVRRDGARTLVDGMTAANDLGLTTAVPAHIAVVVDARLQPIQVGGQVIHFKQAAPSRFYWADRPAMRVVQALYWMHDVLTDPDQRDRVAAKLLRLFADPRQGRAIRDDLGNGFSRLPAWMQHFLRQLIRSDGAVAYG
jgi:hypothetical protein